MDIPYEYARKNNIVLTGFEGDRAVILSKYSIDDSTKSYIKYMLKMDILVKKQMSYEFERVFEQHYSIIETNKDEALEFEKYISAPPEKLLYYIINRSVNLNSTDIHMIKSGSKFAVKFRINSILRTFASIGLEAAQSLIRIIKLKSNIKPVKTLSPLEGRFDMDIDGKYIDIRVSIMPTVDMEKVSMRLLGNIKKFYTFEDINLEQKDEISQILNKKSGFVLVTGPTGSGKSTTIFTMINYLNDGKKNIISIEDPIEYRMDSVTQIPVKKDGDTSFHEILKFVLRQDPDVINIGEIRDLETASLAFDSANTGHMVLSTMHTNDCISSVLRLKDLGIEDFKIASCISVIISQRLVRTLCDNCKKETEIDGYILQKLGLEKDKVYYEPCGCEKCLGTGYSSLMSVFEIIRVDDDIRRLILSEKFNRENISMVSLKDKLIKLFERGETSIEEISKYI